MVDDFTREYPVIEVDTSPISKRGGLFDRFTLTRGVPECIVCVNGQEFAEQDLDQRAHHRGVLLRFTEPGGQVRKAYAGASTAGIET